MKKIRVMIADGNAVVQDGIFSILSKQPDIEVVAKTINCEEAIAKAKALHPDLILLDAQLLSLGHPETTCQIKKQFPEIKVIFLLVHFDQIEKALKAGGDGYLMKDCGREELFKTIRQFQAVLEKTPKHSEHS